MQYLYKIIIEKFKVALIKASFKTLKYNNNTNKCILTYKLILLIRTELIIIFCYYYNIHNGSMEALTGTSLPSKIQFVILNHFHMTHHQMRIEL